MYNQALIVGFSDNTIQLEIYYDLSSVMIGPREKEENIHKWWHP